MEKIPGDQFDQGHLQANADLYRIMTGNIPGISLFLFDEDLRLIIAEGSDIKYFGFETGDFSGMTLYDLSDSEIRSIWIPLFLSAMNNNAETSAEYSYKSSVYQLKVIPVHDSIGGMKLGIASNQNVTDLRKSMQRLKRSKENADAAKTATIDFLAWVSHEIRTPLNSIIGFTEQLLQTTLDKKQEEYIKIIDESSEHLMLLINDILALSKIESGEIHLDHIPFKIRNIVDNLYQTFAARARHKELDFVKHIDERLERVLTGDPLRLRQVLNNLLNNAFKFTDTGFVSIKCILEEESESNVFVRFEIADTGIGISEEDQKIIFEKFKQVESAGRGKYGGTGLGLTICRNLVNLQKGRITLSSKLGSGTTVICLLPYKKGEEDDILLTACKGINSNVLNSKHILLVDDDNFNRLLGKLILEKFNCFFDIAASGREAVELLGKNKYDVILLDMRMPGINGIQVAQFLRRQRKDNATKIVAVTASVLKKELLDYYNSGINDFIVKPFRETDLFGKICQVLGIKGQNYMPAKAELILKQEIIKEPYTITDLKIIANGNEELTLKMLGIFIKNGEKGIADLKRFSRKKEWTEIGETAHKLIPSFRHLHADYIVSNLEKIETSTIINPDLKIVPRLVDSVINAIRELINKIRKDNSLQ